MSVLQFFVPPASAVRKPDPGVEVAAPNCLDPYARLVASMAETIRTSPLVDRWDDWHAAEVLITAGFRISEITEALPDVRRAVQAETATRFEVL